MGETGLVIDLNNNDITVSMARSEACAKCGACITGLNSQEMIISVQNACGAKIGDHVSIELNESVFLSAVAIMYGVPFLALLLGFFAGTQINGYFDIAYNELVSFCLGLILMFLTYFLISKNEPRFKSKRYKPIATKIICKK